MKMHPISDNESENGLQEENDNDIDILDGYLAYDMS